MASTEQRCAICSNYHARPDLSCNDSRLVAAVASEVANLEPFVGRRTPEMMGTLITTVADVVRDHHKSLKQ